MSDSERLSYLQLALTPHIGPVSLLKLLRAFDDVSAVWNLPSSQLKNILSPAAINALNQRQGHQALQDALKWENQHADNHLIGLLDEHYPIHLAQIDAPPPLLFCRGDANLLHTPALAIIGSRHATASGLHTATRFAADLSQLGITIVSGFAAGIDSAAHQGCLDAQGKTIAVLGTGIDRVYPAANRALAHQISEHGLLLSEFPLGTAPIAHNFPKRNRIISALSQAIIVVEASLESGSLITARLGLEMNKEVMAIPGSIHNPQSKGCHHLIKQGAKLVECLEDILEECPNLFNQRPVNDNIKLNTQINNATANNMDFLEVMGFDPIHPDLLVEKLGISAADVYAELLQLELEGQISALAGGRYQRIT